MSSDGTGCPSPHECMTAYSYTLTDAELGDGDVGVFWRTTDQPVPTIKAQRPRTAISIV
jgi:hypothetical protein